MIITINNALAFHLANAARSSNDYQAVFRGVWLSPTGEIAGTDGFRAVYHSSAVDAYEGEAVIIIPLSKVPVKAKGLQYDTESKQLTWNVNGKPGVCLCGEVDSQYPDVKRILPDRAVAIEGYHFGINAEHAYMFGKIIGDYKQVWLYSGKDKPMMLNYTKDRNLAVVSMPVRLLDNESTVLRD